MNQFQDNQHCPFNALLTALWQNDMRGLKKVGLSGRDSLCALYFTDTIKFLIFAIEE
jgi:hypothetical protein